METTERFNLGLELLCEAVLEYVNETKFSCRRQHEIRDKFGLNVTCSSSGQNKGWAAGWLVFHMARKGMLVRYEEHRNSVWWFTPEGLEFWREEGARKRAEKEQARIEENERLMKEPIDPNLDREEARDVWVLKKNIKDKISYAKAVPMFNAMWRLHKMEGITLEEAEHHLQIHKAGKETAINKILKMSISDVKKRMAEQKLENLF